MKPTSSTRSPIIYVNCMSLYSAKIGCLAGGKKWRGEAGDGGGVGRSRSPRGSALFPWIAGKSVITAGICRLLVKMKQWNVRLPTNV